MQIRSPAFVENAFIPQDYTCEGGDQNPPLIIADIPEQAQTLTLMVEDPDAEQENFTHWLVYNIPHRQERLEIASNSVPVDSMVGKNDFGESNYRGPCPPVGQHRYVFTIYALNDRLDLDAGTTKDLVWNAMQGKIIDQAQYVGVYEKGMSS